MFTSKIPLRATKWMKENPEKIHEDPPFMEEDGYKDSPEDRDSGPYSLWLYLAKGYCASPGNYGAHTVHVNDSRQVLSKLNSVTDCFCTDCEDWRGK